MYMAIRRYCRYMVGGGIPMSCRYEEVLASIVQHPKHLKANPEQQIILVGGTCIRIKVGTLSTG